MAKLSINQAWDETRAFLVSEKRLVIAVLLAFVVLPGTLLQLVIPTSTDFATMLAHGSEISGWAILFGYLVIFVNFVGLITLILMALGRRETIGQLIGIAARRTVMLVIAVILAALILLPPIFLILIALIFSELGTLDPNNLSPRLQMFGLIVMLAVLALTFRLALIFPAAAAEDGGPWTLLKRGWVLGRRNALRLIGVFGLLYIAAITVSFALSRVFGTGVALVFGEADRVSVGSLLVGLLTTAATAAFTVIQAGMMASLYRQATNVEKT